MCTGYRVKYDVKELKYMKYEVNICLKVVNCCNILRLRKNVSTYVVHDWELYFILYCSRRIVQAINFARYYNTL